MTYKTVFFGTPEFVIPVLDELKNNPQVDLRYIVSMPDRPAGRGQALHSPPAIQYAKRFNIPFFQTANINLEDDFLEKIKNEKIEVFVVLAFAQFFKEKLLKIPSIGCFNIHTSLLPKYRGPSPIQYALLHGDSSTGVCIQRMVKKMDAGDICVQRTVGIDETDNCATLSEKLSKESSLAVSELYKAMETNSLNFTPQDESKVTFAKIINKEDGFINFKTLSSNEIKRKYNAYYPWPGLYCFLDDKRLKINKISIGESEKLSPGDYQFINSKFIVGTADGTVRLEEVQLEGKKSQPDNVFCNTIKSQNWSFKINP